MGLTDKLNSVEILVEKEEDVKDKNLEMLIDELNLSVSAYNCLQRAGINTAGDLIQKSKKDVIKIHNLGSKSLEEVKLKIKELGLSFRWDE